MKFDNDGCEKTMKFTSEDLKVMSLCYHNYHRQVLYILDTQDLFTLHESTSCDTHDLLERSRRDGQVCPCMQ